MQEVTCDFCKCGEDRQGWSLSCLSPGPSWDSGSGDIKPFLQPLVSALGRPHLLHQALCWAPTSPGSSFFFFSPEFFLLFLSKSAFSFNAENINTSILFAKDVCFSSCSNEVPQRSEFQLTLQVFVPKKPFRKYNNILVLAGISASKGEPGIVK